MFTIATLIFIGLLLDVYFKLSKHLKAKETEVARANLYKDYYNQGRVAPKAVETEVGTKVQDTQSDKFMTMNEITEVLKVAKSLEAINEASRHTNVLDEVCMKAIAKRKKVTKSKYHKRFI